ncbi:MAG: efflux RND transporter periplasmic adaptor subunit [Acidobacteriia bacterium]|nr:efflux RND transporter periplasmic adaptor subunit [Terriglobia bacterium]
MFFNKSKGLFILIAVVVLAGGYWLYSRGFSVVGVSKSSAPQQPVSKAPGERKILYWVDSMNPAYRSDRPGKAPDGMDLVPVYAEGYSATAPGERKILYWMDPMHPAYKSDKPGTAPDCGMTLVPVYADGGGESVGDNLPPGAIKISATKQQLIGVQFGEVLSGPVEKTLRAVGHLAYDETKIIRVHTKISGWIDKVFVDYTGQLVKKGQPLFTVYSPDLLSTQEEFLIGLKAKQYLGDSQFKDVSTGAQSLYNASRRRLQLWDISEAQIEELERTQKPTRDLTLYAPDDGFVTKRNAFPQQQVNPDTEVYEIADLSTIWVLADVYEYELPEVKLGQTARVNLTYFPGKTFAGKVSYIYPEVDNTTRTAKVRIDLPNGDFKLKPDMYASVELQINYGRQLSVPQEAVLDSGAEQTVFVALGNGYFEPRKVQLGAKVDDRYIVLGGLRPQEKVVTSGNFLIDSESQLKSAVAAMAGMPGNQTQDTSHKTQDP